MTRTSYKEIIVVEGKNDASRISKLYPEVEVLITNGSEVSKEFIDNLKKLSEEHEIILFLDPDYPGQRIRSILENSIKNVKHAFIDKKKAIDERKHKVGVEHATDEDLRESLNNMLTVSDQELGTLTTTDLMDLGLIGLEDSVAKREYLSTIYPIGKTNGKTLLKRLNYLRIEKKELEEVLDGLYRNGRQN